VVSILDFSSGQRCYQASIDVSCLALGSPSHDPCQLLVGARDGTVSVWRPPQEVATRIQSLLGECYEAYQSSSPPPLLDISEAVAWYWATALQGKINWASWGEGTAEATKPGREVSISGDGSSPGISPLPLLPIPPPPPQASQGPEDENDIVVQARKHWSAMPIPGADRALPMALAQPAVVTAPPAAPALAVPRTLAAQSDVDPISGLEVAEIPGGVLPLPGQMSALPAPGYRSSQNHPGNQNEQKWQRPSEPAELLVAAPEFREEFGTRAEHFQDPLPSRAPRGPDDTGEPLPRWLEQGRPFHSSDAEKDLVRAVFSELDKFESAHPDTQVLESPRDEVA